MQHIILASQSPRRKQLLEWAEIPFEIIIKPTDESFPDDMPVEQVPEFIAETKARVIHESLQNSYHAQYAETPVLAADTVVLLNGCIIGKPKNREHAVETLKALSGNIHNVITGVVILNAKKKISFSDNTEVHFHSLTGEQIEFYVDKYQPYDKAGAYAIQEWIGVIGIKKIIGDFYNVMGLPVSRVVHALNDFNK
jgi:septum formation protein